MSNYPQDYVDGHYEGYHKRDKEVADLEAEIERLTVALARAQERLDTIDKALAKVADTWARISALRVMGS